MGGFSMAMSVITRWYIHILQNPIISRWLCTHHSIITLSPLRARCILRRLVSVDPGQHVGKMLEINGEMRGFYRVLYGFYMVLYGFNYMVLYGSYMVLIWFYMVLIVWFYMVLIWFYMVFPPKASDIFRHVHSYGGWWRNPAPPWMVKTL